MKRKFSRMWRSGMALLMALCLMIGLCPTDTFATEAEKKINYVSLGDSMTNGYCFKGYNQGSDDSDELDFIDGRGVYGEAAYPNQFEDWLKTQGYSVNHVKLASSAMRAEDLNYLLGGREKPDDGWFEEILNYTGVNDADELSKFYVESVSNADLITMCIGNASFGAYMLHTVTDALGLFGDLEQDEMVDLEKALINLEPEQKQLVLDIYNQMKAEFTQYIPADLAKQYKVDEICDIIAYTAAGFILNYKGVLDRIMELNPDVEIILIGVMNTTYGMKITAEGMDDIPVGDIMDGVFSALNAYIAALPTVMQAAGEWQDAKFYYAEDTAPLFISQEFANLKKANWGNVDEGRLSGTIVRERNIKAYNDSLREIIGEALNIDSLSKISLKNVQEVENNGMTGDNGIDLSCAIYLGIEDAVAVSTDTMDIPLTGLIKIATDLSSVFENFEITSGDIRKDLGEYLTSTDELKGMCKIYALFKVGNGMSVHPTPAGHDNIAKAVIASYEAKHTVKDETIENVEIALDALYNLIEQYGPEVLDQAYNYAVEQGCVEALETAVAELKAELEARTENYINEAKPAMEAAIADLEAEANALNEKLAAMKAELEAKKAELEAATGDAAEDLAAVVDQLEKSIAALEDTIAAVEAQITDIEAAIENLKTGLAALEEELTTLAEAVADLEDSVTNVLDVMKNASGSVESVIAAVDAAKDTVEAAVALVATTYDQVEKLVNEVVALAEMTGEKVAALAEMVAADLQAAYDSLPEDVKAEINTAIAEIQKNAEEAKAVIEAELAEQIADLKAELQPVIDAKVAELEELLAQIEAEVEAKTAELKAEAEAKIAELNAAAEAKKAELEAQLAEKYAELEALKAELENAAEEAKAEIEAKIAEVEKAIEDLKAQMEQIVTDLEEAVAAVEAELEKKIAEIREEIEAAYAKAVEDLEQAIEELKAELDEKITELTEAAEQKIAEIMAGAEKKIAELKAAGEEIAEELAAVMEEVKAVVEAVKAEVEAVTGETIDNVEELLEAAKAMAAELTETIENKVDEVIEALKEAYINATTSDYVPNEDSFYVAIGDSSAVSESYVDVLAADLDIDYANLAQENLMIEDTYAILEQNADTIAKADLITVGFTSNGFVNETIDHVLNQTMGGTVELDWAAYVGAENVIYVQKALKEVSARIAESVEDAQMAAMLSTAIEAYAYSCVAYACNLPEVVNAIRAINPDAAIIIVGMYNPLEDVTVWVDENTSVNIGEYLDYLTQAAGIHATAYAMLTSNGVYIAAPDVQTIYEENNGSTDITVQELIYEYLRNKGENMLPSAAGHEYIAAQIANGLGKNADVPDEPGLLGDANSDGIVDSYDATLIMQYDVDMIDETQLDLSVCDVSGDGVVDSYDATLIQQYDVDMIPSFPAQG